MPVGAMAHFCCRKADGGHRRVRNGSSVFQKKQMLMVDFAELAARASAKSSRIGSHRRLPSLVSFAWSRYKDAPDSLSANWLSAAKSQASLLLTSLLCF
jgi:hypothetical protein